MKLKKFSLLGLLAVLCLIALLVALLLPKTVKAQPYYTNTAAFGAAAYNANLPTPLQAQQTLAAQYASGTQAGLIPTNLVAYLLLTNSFATNIYTAPPIVTASAGQSGIITNAIVTIVSTSPTNFVLQVTPTNVPIYWEATGH